jgi:hypothetical protein
MVFRGIPEGSPERCTQTGILQANFSSWDFMTRLCESLDLCPVRNPRGEESEPQKIRKRISDRDWGKRFSRYLANSTFATRNRTRKREIKEYERGHPA